MKRNIFIISLLLILIATLFIAIVKKENKIVENQEINQENEELENDNEKEEVEEENKEIEQVKKVEGTINHSVNYENEELDAFLKKFFDEYYEILQTLEYEDVEKYFENREVGYIYKTALDILIENRKSKMIDLKLLVSDYNINVTKYQKTNDEINLTILENSVFKFKFNPQSESHIYNIENSFTIVKINDEYKIKNFKKVQDFYVLITDVYKETNAENYKEKLDKIKNNYLDLFKKQKAKEDQFRSEYLNNEYKPLKCDNEYDREAARTYAISWVGKRNDKWHAYSANCVNFVSQVMYAGGIPMDHDGSEQWKWYGTKKNTQNEPIGFVYSWTYVPSIVEYFKKNTGFGLCGKYDENIYYAEPGDVIVVGSKGPDRHVITVIDQVKDEDGHVVDLLVNSNTVDLDYFPLSAYAYPYKVLMKVYGWNNK